LGSPLRSMRLHRLLALLLIGEAAAPSGGWGNEHSSRHRPKQGSGSSLPTSGQKSSSSRPTSGKSSKAADNRRRADEACQPCGGVQDSRCQCVVSNGRRLFGASQSSTVCTCTWSPPPPSPLAPPPCPVALYEWLAEETYTGVTDCARGTIQSGATAAALPMGSAPFTATVEFKVSGQTPYPSDAVLWSYGYASNNQMNALSLQCATTSYNAPHINWFWYADDLLWNFDNDGVLASEVCDGQFHTITLIWDGSTKRLLFDGVQRTSGAPTGASHAASNTNFCLGGESARGLPFTGTLRNFQIFASPGTWTVSAACLATS